MLQLSAFSEIVGLPPSPFRMLKEVSIALVVGSLFLCSVPTNAYATEPDSEEPGPIVLAGAERILGHWRRGKGEAIIEITERKGVCSGVIVWSHKRPETVGIEIFRELRYDDEEREWHGRAYSIKRKREVRIDIAVPKNDKLDLTAHILGIFTKDVGFTRVPNAEVAARTADRGL